MENIVEDEPADISVQTRTVDDVKWLQIIIRHEVGQQEIDIGSKNEFDRIMGELLDAEIELKNSEADWLNG